MPEKACPVVIRQSELTGEPEVLAFRHPLAGLQVVKGSVEAGESLFDACRRELFEESGLHATPARYLGALNASGTEEWGLVLMDCNESLPDHWSHETLDGGGLLFDFFWYPLTETPGDQWHPAYVVVLDFLCGEYGR